MAMWDSKGSTCAIYGFEFIVNLRNHCAAYAYQLFIQV